MTVFLGGLLVACSGDEGRDSETEGVATDASSSGASTTGASSSSAGVTTAASSSTGAETGASTSSAGSDGSTSEGETSTSETTGGEPLSEDEELLRAAIAGEVDPAEALATIAGRGGLPVETASGSFLFACLCGPGGWSLAGDHEGWEGQGMETTGALSWIELELPAPDGSRYKFTDGGDQWIADPLGRRHDYDDFGRISLVRASAAHLERWYSITGYELAPRDLEVWVPDDGEFDRALYVHDAQNLFNPDAPFGSWALQESAPPGVLLVGVDTPARMDEYTHVADDIGGGMIGGEGDRYADLVELVIRPLIEEAYGEVELVGVMGSSLGGLISFHIADRFPDRYAMALSLSGTMGWGSLDGAQPLGLTMIDRYSAAGYRSTALYLDSGGGGACSDDDADGIEDDGVDSDNYCVNLQFFAELQSIGYTDGLDVFHWHEPGAMHNEAAWAARVSLPLQLFAEL